MKKHILFLGICLLGAPSVTEASSSMIAARRAAERAGKNPDAIEMSRHLYVAAGIGLGNEARDRIMSYSNTDVAKGMTAKARDAARRGLSDPVVAEREALEAAAEAAAKAEDEERASAATAAATKIQSTVRGYQAKESFKAQREDVIKLQAFGRGYLARKTAAVLKAAQQEAAETAARAAAEDAAKVEAERAAEALEVGRRLAHQVTLEEERRGAAAVHIVAPARMATETTDTDAHTVHAGSATPTFAGNGAFSRNRTSVVSTPKAAGGAGAGVTPARTASTVTAGAESLRSGSSRAGRLDITLGGTPPASAGAGPRSGTPGMSGMRGNTSFVIRAATPGEGTRAASTASPIAVSAMPPRVATPLGEGMGYSKTAFNALIRSWLQPRAAERHTVLEDILLPTQEAAYRAYSNNTPLMNIWYLLGTWDMQEQARKGDVHDIAFYLTVDKVDRTTLLPHAVLHHPVIRSDGNGARNRAYEALKSIWDKVKPACEVDVFKDGLIGKIMGAAAMYTGPAKIGDMVRGADWSLLRGDLAAVFGVPLSTAKTEQTQGNARRNRVLEIIAQQERREGPMAEGIRVMLERAAMRCSNEQWPAVEKQLQGRTFFGMEEVMRGILGAEEDHVAGFAPLITPAGAACGAGSSSVEGSVPMGRPHPVVPAAAVNGLFSPVGSAAAAVAATPSMAQDPVANMLSPTGYPQPPRTAAPPADLTAFVETS